MKAVTRRTALRLGAVAPIAARFYDASAQIAETSQASQGSGRLIPIQTMTATATPAHQLRFGIGFNWVDRFPVESALPVYPALEDKLGWAAVHAALDQLQPGFLRFWIDSDACVGSIPGHINTSAATLHRAKIVSDWVEQTDCSLLLDTSHVPKQFQFAQTPAQQKALKTQPFIDMAARDNAAFARDFVVPLLRHILVDRKMAGFRYYNAYNEPLQYGPFSTPNNTPDPYLHYVEMYREIQTQLRDAGLYPNRIRLAGVEAIEPSGFPALKFLARGVDIDPYIDLYTIHSYFHRLDWMNPVPVLQESIESAMDRGTPPLVEYCQRRGKPLLAAEIGWYANDNDPSPMPTDPLASSRHQATLITAENMVRGMNAGLAGFGIWSLFNHGAFDGAWQVISYQNGRIEKAEHPYAMYSLFSRYARPGSSVFSLRTENREWPWQYVHATSLLTPQDEVVIYVVNDHLVESRKIHLKLPIAWKGRALRRIVKDNERLGVQTGIITLRAENGHSILDDLVYASSLTAYVQHAE